MNRMAGNRRMQRHGSAKLEQQMVEDVNSPIMNTQAPLPRHCILPDIQSLNEVVYQLGYLANTLVMMTFQYLNLYNTIWWMPHNHHEYAIDVSAIDIDLVVLLVLLLSYRLLLNALAGVCEKASAAPGLASMLATLMKYTTLCVYLIAISGTFILITYKYPPRCWLFLVVPVGIYLLLFGPNISRYLAKQFPWLPLSRSTHPYDLLVPPPTQKTSRNIYHACSMNPEHVRREVFILKTDFNYRLKTVYFEAIISVYYGTIIPVIFCKNIHHLDMTWIACYILVAGLTMALVGFVQRVPATYMDTLHKSAVHLGSWRKHEERLINIPHSVWSELTVWPKGVNVKHVKGLFKAEGINNTAEPGNPMHSKFYMMFKHPEYMCAAIAGLSFLCVFIQLVMLAEFRFWNQVLATAALMLSNYYALSLSCRDFMVLYQVYKDEKFRYE